MDNKLDREVESVFQIILWNNLDDSPIASKLDFKLNHLLNKVFQKRKKQN